MKDLLSMEKLVKTPEKKEAETILEQYSKQTEDQEDVHFEHYDWTYNDGSCCC